MMIGKKIHLLGFALVVCCSVGQASAQDFFTPQASQASSTRSVAETSSGSQQVDKMYQQWLQQFSKIQNQALQQQLIDPAQYGLPMPKQTGNSSLLQGGREQ